MGKSVFALKVEDSGFWGLSSHLEKGTGQDWMVSPGDGLSEVRLRSQKESLLVQWESGAALTSG